MFETQQNRSFGLAAVAQCTANENAAANTKAGWRGLWDEVIRYPALSKSVRDALWKSFQAAEDWYANAFGSGGIWCARKEDLVAHQTTLERAKGALSVAIQGLPRVEPTPSKPGGGVVTLPEEHITGYANWWGLTLGVLAFSAAAIIARRRRAGLDGVKSFRRKYRKGGRR